MSAGGIESRWAKYRTLNQSVVKQKRLYAALKKHGPNSFKYEVILMTDNIERAKAVERQLIALWNLQGKYGYNCTVGGELEMLGFKHSLVSRQRMSDAQKGREGFWKGKKRDCPWFRNRKRSLTELDAISKRMKGNVPWNKGKKNVYSEETKILMGLGRLGKVSPRKGIKHSPETLQKMSASLKGRISPMKGRKMSLEAVEKMRLSKIGKKTRPRTEQEKELIRQRIKEHWLIRKSRINKEVEIANE